jgi:hypothetical protein
MTSLIGKASHELCLTPEKISHSPQPNGGRHKPGRSGQNGMSSALASRPALLAATPAARPAILEHLAATPTGRRQRGPTPRRPVGVAANFQGRFAVGVAANYHGRNTSTKKRKILAPSRERSRGLMRSSQPARKNSLSVPLLRLGSRRRTGTSGRSCTMCFRLGKREGLWGTLRGKRRDSRAMSLRPTV